MAIRHGLAGQFGKVEARRISLAGFVYALMFGMAVSNVAAFWLGYHWSRKTTGVALLAVVAFALLTVIGLRRLSQYFDEASKHRIKYLRGGQAEGLVAWILESDLDDAWHVFNSVKLDATSDHDHVVVGPGGLFLVSTKSHRGWFVGSAAELKRNLKPSPFASDARRQAARLAERLRAVMGDGVPWIQAVLCVPFGYTDGDVFNGQVWLTHAEDLTDRIAPANAPRMLNKDQVARIVKAMEMIHADAAKIYARRP